ncbi:MAG: hypothetical protein JXA37_01705 [Chloroflexia bacterium]|nr:hypothetical protein [Chloroflexia bacterium]
MSKFVKKLWPSVRMTLISLLIAVVLALVLGYMSGCRQACAFSNAFFWSAAAVFLIGGAVAAVGGRGQHRQIESGRRSLRELEREKERSRQERYRARELAINQGIAIALAGVPLLLITWLLCP